MATEVMVATEMAADLEMPGPKHRVKDQQVAVAMLRQLHFHTPRDTARHLQAIRILVCFHKFSHFCPNIKIETRIYKRILLTIPNYVDDFRSI